jgi:hypothetical protein
MANSLSMYSITENIYYSQLSSVAILLQPEPVSHRIIQGKDCVLSPYVLSPCGLPFHPTCLLVTVNEARGYFTSTILSAMMRHIHGGIVDVATRHTAISDMCSRKVACTTCAVCHSLHCNAYVNMFHASPVLFPSVLI